MEFASPFDEALARTGPAAVFLPDREGRLRFAPEWTMEAWDRAVNPHEAGWVWVLVRDHDTGYVNLALCTSPGLLIVHPKGDVRRFETEADAVAAREAIGRPYVAREPW